VKAIHPQQKIIKRVTGVYSIIHSLAESLEDLTEFRLKSGRQPAQCAAGVDWVVSRDEKRELKRLSQL
jgi:hypothetical protein